MTKEEKEREIQASMLGTLMSITQAVMNKNWVQATFVIGTLWTVCFTSLVATKPKEKRHLFAREGLEALYKDVESILNKIENAETTVVNVQFVPKQGE